MLGLENKTMGIENETDARLTDTVIQGERTMQCLGAEAKVIENKAADLQGMRESPGKDRRSK